MHSDASRITYNEAIGPGAYFAGAFVRRRVPAPLPAAQCTPKMAATRASDTSAPESAATAAPFRA